MPNPLTPEQRARKNARRREAAQVDPVRCRLKKARQRIATQLGVSSREITDSQAYTYLAATAIRKIAGAARWSWASRNPERVKAYRKAAKARRRELYPEKVKAERKAAYAKHRDRERRQHLEWSRRPEVRAYRLERTAAWRAANPEKVRLLQARHIIARAIGVRIRDVSVEVAEVKVLQMKVNKALGGKKIG